MNGIFDVRTITLQICMIILLEWLQIWFGADCFRARKYTFMKKVMIYSIMSYTYISHMPQSYFFSVMKAHVEALKKKRLIEVSNWSRLVQTCLKTYLDLFKEVLTFFQYFFRSYIKVMKERMEALKKTKIDLPQILLTLVWTCSN